MANEDKYLDYSGLETFWHCILSKIDDSLGSISVDTTLTISGVPADAKAVGDALETKQDTITGSATTILNSTLTANRVLGVNNSGKIAVSGISLTKLGYLSDVTGNIQSQLNSITTSIDTLSSTVAGKISTSDISIANSSSGNVVTDISYNNGTFTVTKGTISAGSGTDSNAVQKTGDTMTGDLEISTALYPSLKLIPTYGGTTNRTVFEGSYAGASSFSAWNDDTGNNRRMIEIRNSSYEADLDDAVVLRDVIDGSYYSYRIYHRGMSTAIPTYQGGTGASTISGARINLGIQCGTANISIANLSPLGTSSTTIYFSETFSSIPIITVTPCNTTTNDNFINYCVYSIKNITTSSFTLVATNLTSETSGSIGTRQVKWIAIG